MPNRNENYGRLLRPACDHRRAAMRDLAPARSLVAMRSGATRFLRIAGISLAITCTTVAAGAAEETSPPTASNEAIAEPQATITVDDALNAALAKNPELNSLGVEIGVREALAVQQGLPANPAITTEVENVAGSGAHSGWDAGETTVSVEQLVQLGGKRGKRRTAAELERDVAAWDYRARRADLVAEVKKAFVATLAAQDHLLLSDDLLNVASTSVKTVAATVRAGAVSPVEHRRAQLALESARTERLARSRDLAISRAALAATWASSAARFERVQGYLSAISPPPALDALRSLIDANPDLARWATELAQREAALAVEKAQRVPDVTLAAGGRYFSEDGDGALVFGFSLPLPLIDRNQGNVLAAERALAQVESRRDAVRVAVGAALATAYESQSAAFEQATTLRDRILPEAQQAYEGARDAYGRGLFRYLEVLDAQRTLFELRDQYLDALTDYHVAATDLERLTGPFATPVEEPRRKAQ